MELKGKNDILIYLTHKFFSNFTLNLFFIFGALLIYEKTNSMILTLFFYLVHYIFIIANISILLNIFIKILNTLQTKLTMILGLILISLSYVLLFYIPNDINGYKILLFLIAFIMAVGSNFYYIPFNTINFTLIGTSEKPGIWASFLSSNSIVAGIVASLLAITMNIKDNINLLLLFAGISLLVSCIFLYFINIPHKKLEINFKSYIKLISFKESFAFMESSHEMKNIGLPIVAFYLFGSLGESIIVSSLIALGAIITIFFAGYLKDKNNNLFLILASILGIVPWFAFLFISSKVGFIILGIIIGLTYKIINTSFEANFGRKLSNSSTRLEFSLANDFSKIIGRIIIISLLIIIYSLTNNISPIVLCLGGLFLIPKIMLSLKRIDNIVVVN